MGGEVGVGWALQQVALGASARWQVEKETPVPLPPTSHHQPPYHSFAKTWISSKKASAFVVEAGK